MKKIISVILAITMLMSCMIFTSSAADKKAESLSLTKARYFAVFSLASSAPASVAPYGVVKLGRNFELSDALPLFNPNGETTHWCFEFTSTAVDGLHGYITVSANPNEPIISETVFGDMPYNEGTVFVAPGIYFTRDSEGRYVNVDGDVTYTDDIFAAQAQYNKTLQQQDVMEKIFALNEQTKDALNKTTLLGYLNGFDREALNAFLEYYFGWVSIYGSDNEEAHRDVEEFIKESTGNIYTVTESYVVDKTYVRPHPQSYYRPSGSGDGICGKASAMMMLAFYRDGRGFDKLPSDDKVMYEELSKVYDDMTAEFSFVFDSSLIKEKFGAVNSYEIFAFYEAGISIYLKSKGYDEEAWNVINNMSFSIPLISESMQTLLLKDLRNKLSDMIFAKTDGKVNIPTTLDVSANDVIVRSIVRGEPAVIGCIWSIGTDTYTNHYFEAVGYYKLRYDFKLWGLIPVGSISKEYVEIYDTWSWSYTSIIDWSVFSATAIYSATSIASLY